MAAAVMDLGGTLVTGIKNPKCSALVEPRRSLPLNVKPFLPASRSATSFSSSIGSDFFDPGAPARDLSKLNRRSKMDQSEFVTLEKLDQWLRDSISEIVSDIRKAPLLVHMFSEGEGADVSVESEAASPDIWSCITGRWNREKRMPDGVVLVEELGGDGEENRTWGLVVQGRGVSYPACYILNTCRVPSTGGFCTHFCLVRAECYGESAQMQLMRAWSR